MCALLHSIFMEETKLLGRILYNLEWLHGRESLEVSQVHIYRYMLVSCILVGCCIEGKLTLGWRSSASVGTADGSYILDWM